MTRLHRAITKRARKVNPEQVANQAEYYIESLSLYKKELEKIRGIANSQRIRKLIQKIDKLETEIIRYENRIDRLEERRNLEAAKLETILQESMQVARDHLTKDEFKDFKG